VCNLCLREKSDNKQLLMFERDIFRRYMVEIHVQEEDKRWR
jgi:hypothetical protein